MRVWRLTLIGLSLLVILTPAAIADEPAETPPGNECSVPDFTVRDMVVYTCNNGYWVPLACQVDLCVPPGP